jgi:TRAP-type transport system periplasmic protein
MKATAVLPSLPLEIFRTAVFLLASSIIAGARADPIELTFGHNGGPGSLYEISANEFVRRVNERLAGKAHLTAAGNSALGDDDTLLEKVKSGAVTFAIPASVMSSVDGAFGIFEMPFLIRDRSHMARVRDALLLDVFEPAVQRKGYRILAVWELGFRHITNNVRPIRDPEDLKGLRLRVPKGIWRAKMFASYGAIPIPLSLDKTLEAIQSGQVDGQENPLQQIYAQHLDTQQKYLTLSFHLYSPAFLLVSEEHFSKLPPYVQSVLTKTAIEIEDYSQSEGEKLDRELLEKLSSSMIVNDIDLMEFFHEAAVGIYFEFASSSPGHQALLEKVESLIKR